MPQRDADIESAGLDLFLESGRPARPLKGEALKRAIARVMEPVRADLDALPEETLPHRIAAMWRIVRHTVVVKGLAGQDEKLRDATEIHPCPWTNPTLPFSGPSAQRAMRRGTAATFLALHARRNGLPLLPAGDDEEVQRWCHAASIVVKDLKVTDTPAGLAGVEHILQPRLARYNDVSIDMVLAFEDLVIEEAQSAIFQAGERPAMKHLRERLGLTRNEALGLVALARASLTDDIPTSVEIDRAFMVAQLREQIAAAKASLDLDQEFKALKLLAMVQGLTRSEPENAAKDFLSVVKRVSAEQDAKLLEQQEKGGNLIDAATATPAQFVDHSEYIPLERETPDEDEDEEALRAFDRENS